jgi:hypothetical protein
VQVRRREAPFICRLCGDHFEAANFERCPLTARPMPERGCPACRISHSVATAVCSSAAVLSSAASRCLGAPFVYFPRSADSRLAPLRAPKMIGTPKCANDRATARM